MKVKTHLVSGAGNTFHLTFGNPMLPAEAQRALAVRTCAANPADGFIFLNENSGEYFWDFYNNDGSLAEMCGNATRCVGYYIKNILKSDKSEWSLKTTAGPINIQFVSSEMFRILMTPVLLLSSDLGFYCDTGVPHLVLEKKFLKVEAKAIRNHPQFAPKGTNVTYVEFLNAINQVKAVSYERGVENFTEACGTGAVAAAAYNLNFRGAVQTEVEMPGGTLIIDLSDLKKPVMTGPAVLLGSYEYEITT